MAHRRRVAGRGDDGGERLIGSNRSDAVQEDGRKNWVALNHAEAMQPPGIRAKRGSAAREESVSCAAPAWDAGEFSLGQIVGQAQVGVDVEAR